MVDLPTIHTPSTRSLSNTEHVDIEKDAAGAGKIEEEANYEHEEMRGTPMDKNNALEAVKSREPEYPSMKKAVVIMIGLYLAVFIIALDRTIIGTAIPRMTDEFHSFQDIGWYQAAYMLTTAGFQLFFGR